MTSIVTGDIINSRNISVEKWLPILKNILNKIGNSPASWEIYRGDSFQVEVSILNALKTCLLIKASLKTIAALDVRMAIGIGEKTFENQHITESNGKAHINSGYAFDNLLKKQSLAIKSPWKEFDEELNISLALGLLTMDNWSVNSAEFVKISLENPTMTQREISKLLGISQAGISKRKKRAGLDEILRLEKRYQKLINQKP
ncbi:SatD family protein [Tenacibaculum sp. UWU-22]|uniref:SatD family protein n=1 Tax=Tenacibaculum sp. UWU-22 TaxID=3234187 RepID=UPI0034DAF3C4